VSFTSGIGGFSAVCEMQFNWFRRKRKNNKCLKEENILNKFS
jgi:hypothetical protein